jgi:hypothetical protein
VKREIVGQLVLEGKAEVLFQRWGFQDKSDFQERVASAKIRAGPGTRGDTK